MTAITHRAPHAESPPERASEGLAARDPFRDRDARHRRHRAAGRAGAGDRLRLAPPEIPLHAGAGARGAAAWPVAVDPRPAARPGYRALPLPTGAAVPGRVEH